MSSLARSTALPATPPAAPIPGVAPLRLLPGGRPTTDLRGTRPAAPAASRPAAPAGRRVMALPAYVALLTVVMLSAMLGTLLVNTVLTQGAFDLQDAQRQATVLRDRQEELTQQVAAAESPIVIEQRARALGMVPAASPVFLRLADSAVLGEPVPARPEPAARR